MTSSERKHNSEKIIASLGFTIDDHLPLIEETDVALRSPQEVAERILVLTYLNCVASDPSFQQEVMMFLIREKLWDKVTEQEKALFHKTQLTEDDITIIFWRIESIWTLLWVIEKVPELNLPDSEVDLHQVFPFLPGFLEPVGDFIQQATMRSATEILVQYDLIFRLNWAIQKQLEISPTPKLNIGIAYERYFSMEWTTQGRTHWDETAN